MDFTVVDPVRDRPLMVVADGAPDIRTLVHAIFRQEFDVIEAGDGFAALHVCRDERPDVLLCDVHLPFMSGLEVAAELRGVVPRIALMSADWLTAAEVIASGNPPVINKPFSLAEIRRVCGTTATTRV